jgi:hypothetical protein
MPARIIFSFFIGAFFLWKTANFSLGAELRLSQVPLEVQFDQEFTARVSYKTSVKNQKYFLRTCFYLPETTNYFGCIKNTAAEWICGPQSDKTKYFELETNNEGIWEGDIFIKADQGSGDYKLKIRRYTAAGSSEDSNEVNIKIKGNEGEFLASPSPLSDSPSPWVQKATCQIKEVKNQNGEVLSSVKIYVDGVYTHHYAPESLSFCPDCPDGNFGSHIIKLEKNGYQDWIETKDFLSGNNYEINAVMKQVETAKQGDEEKTNNQSPSNSQNNSQKTSLISAKPSAVSQVISAKAKPAGSFEQKLPILATPSAEVKGEATALAEPEDINKSIFSQFALPIGLCILGIIFLGVSFYPQIFQYIKRK